MTGVLIYERREVRIPTRREGVRTERRPWEVTQTRREEGHVQTAVEAGVRKLREKPVWAPLPFHQCGH